MKHALCTLALLALAASALAQNEPKLDGRWEGDIVVPAQPVRIIVVFATDGASLTATMDVPSQNVADKRLANVRQSGPRIHFELPTPSGAATFDGEWIQGVIRGDFKQGDLSYRFTLERKSGETELAVDYRKLAVRVTSGNVTLAGTLTMPNGQGPFPAVVLIPDSGRENRDDELFGFKGFERIADHLTTRGIAVLRCDGRGVGGSTGDPKAMTPADFADDAEAQVRFLRQRQDIQPNRIGLLGHGEGAVAAARVAARSKDVAFLVLMGGAAVPGDKLTLAQIEAAQRIHNLPAAARAEEIDLWKRVFQAVRSGESIDPIVAEVKARALRDLEAARKRAEEEMARLPKDQQRPVPDTSRTVAAAVDAQFAQARTPWFRAFLDDDPAAALSKVTVPVLALFGELDTQAPVPLNRPAMEAALQKAGNKDVTVKVFPLANHLFIPALSGSVEEYPLLPKVFAPTFLDTLSAWMTKQTAAR